MIVRTCVYSIPLLRRDVDTWHIEPLQVLTVDATFCLEWNNAAALVSYKAARTTEELSAEEANILDQLYDRLTYWGKESVVAFWGTLREYRSRWLQSSKGQPMTPARASQLVESFK